MVGEKLLDNFGPTDAPMAEPTPIQMVNCQSILPKIKKMMLAVVLTMPAIKFLMAFAEKMDKVLKD